MKSFKSFTMILLILIPFFLTSCTKDELSNEGNSGLALPSFLLNYVNAENHSSVKIKANLSVPVKDSWLNENNKFGHLCFDRK